MLVYLISFEEFTKSLADLIFGIPLIILLLGAGIYFSIKTNFVQIRRLKLMVKLLFIGENSEKGISSFQAFAVSVAGRIGTGSIAGIATAIALGGPGALFWMWVLTIVSSASAFIEATLAQIFKKEVDGEYRGGPAYYFEIVSGKRIYGILFAIITIITMSMLLPGVQSNTIAGAIQQAFFNDTNNVVLVKIIISIIVVLILAVIIIGGTKRLSRFAEIVVPIMSIAYIVIVLVIIIANYSLLPEIFSMVFKYAFTPIAGFGGVVGTAVLNGVKRGIFSNEAGQGSGPHAAAAAHVNHPVEQGLVQIFSVYFAIIVCTMTGLVILITNAYYLQGASGIVTGSSDIYGSLSNSGVEVGSEFTQIALSSLLGDSIGYKFIAIALFFFAFTTLLAYYYMAETNVAYLSAKRDKNGILKSNYILLNFVRLIFFVVVIGFSAPKATAIFNIADTGVGLMSTYNIVGILIIATPAIKALKDYEKQLKAGVKNPKFEPEKLNIKNTEVW